MKFSMVQKQGPPGLAIPRPPAVTEVLDFFLGPPLKDFEEGSEFVGDRRLLDNMNLLVEGLPEGR
jgi:hypothetical protein